MKKKLIFGFKFARVNIETIKEGEFEYIEKGDGPVVILLHGLMGGLDNFEQLINQLPNSGYKVVGPLLPLFDKPLLKTSIKHFTKYIHSFIEFKGYKDVTLIGNSLGGHISLVFAQKYPDLVKRLVLTGSSGLYESSMGSSFPRRGDYEYIQTKTQEVFYDPKMATKSLVDKVFDIANKRESVIRLLTMAKSAIRHNMSKDIPNLSLPVCLIWGKQDTVTPPHVAEEFHRLFPNSSLYWIDKCGHSPMWEHPQEFIKILEKWLSENSI